MKAILFFSTFISDVLLAYNLKGQSLCLSDPIIKGMTSPKKIDSEFQMESMQECKLYWINVYIHRVNGNGYGYSSSIDNIIINNLNSSFNQYGFYFQLSGSRDWLNNFYASPNTPTFALQGIFDDSGASQHSNAIDIYVLPSNSQIQGGFVPSNNKKVMAIGGSKIVSHCSGGSTNYEIAKTRVVSHEMGHCFSA